VKKNVEKRVNMEKINPRREKKEEKVKAGKNVQNSRETRGKQA